MPPIPHSTEIESIFIFPRALNKDYFSISLRMENCDRKDLEQQKKSEGGFNYCETLAGDKKF